jgi:hypothetical protein
MKWCQIRLVVGLAGFLVCFPGGAVVAGPGVDPLPVARPGAGTVRSGGSAAHARGDSAAMQALWQAHYLPRAQALEAAAASLAQAAEAQCAGRSADETRRAWEATLVAWLRLVTVEGGPLLHLRSRRLMDFPTVLAERMHT